MYCSGFRLRPRPRSFGLCATIPLFSVLVAVVFAGCTSGPPRSAPVAASGAARTTGTEEAGSTVWPTSAPEALGMDSARLGDLLQLILDRDLPIHALVVVRDGSIVTEAYRAPFDADTVNDLASCQKSVISALVGVAIDRQFVRGTGQRVVELMPELSAAVSDPRTRALTLENLLTMSSGLSWDEWRPNDGENSWVQMNQSADRFRFALGRDVAVGPGRTWNYNSSLPELAAAMVERASAMPFERFARTYLFDPLGITALSWRGTPRDTMSIALRARDMAKLGLLFLNQGSWEGKRVISRRWVKDSTTAHIDTSIDGNRYGYFWWVPPYGGFAAEGDGGQRISVFPARRLVVVVTAGLSYPDMETLPDELMTRYLLPAVVSAGPLPPNRAGVARLAALKGALARNDPMPAAPAPALAERVSGRTYELESNTSGMERFALRFTDQGTELELGFAGRSATVAVGLDNVYRVTPVPTIGPIYGWVGARGRWLTESTFSIDFLMSGVARRFDFAFNGDRATVWYHGSRGEQEPIAGREVGG